MKSRHIHTLLALIFSILLFFFFAHTLYYCNNKYQSNTVQPIGGVLMLSEEDLNSDTPLFLSHQWACFPEALLTPKDFTTGNVPESRYFTLGSYANFSYGDTSHSPQGSTTYRLTVSLPESPSTYALYLPEIFSAYTLWLNDEEMWSQGNPSPRFYKDKIGSKMLAFTAGGTLHITIAVTNYSHIYSGMVYPPAFGHLSAVEKYNSIRILHSGISLTVILLSGLFSLFFACRLKHKNAGLFAILCGILFISSLYPILFSYGTFSAWPWYPLELFCLTAMYPLILLLQGKILKLSKKILCMETVFFLLSSLVALLFCLLFSENARFASFYSLFIFLFKASCSVILLAQACYAYRYSVAASPVLLVGTVLFACSLITDRIYSDYEPIYGGWFQEIGAFFLVISIACELSKEMTDAYRSRLLLREETHALTRQIEIQKTHYMELNDRIDESIRLRHDHRHHLQTLLSYLQQNKIEKSLEYLNQYVDSRERSERIMLCRHMLADALFQYYKARCNEDSIAFECLADLPADIPIADTDFSILFGNLLENAYEAASLVKSDAYIKIQLQSQKDKIIALIENNYEIEPVFHNNRLDSTKHAGAGIGTKSATLIVEKNKGVIEFDTQNHVFSVRLVLPFPAATDL